MLLKCTLKMVLTNFILCILSQLKLIMNVIDLYTLSGWSVCYVNYVSIKLLGKWKNGLGGVVIVFLLLRHLLAGYVLEMDSVSVHRQDQNSDTELYRKGGLIRKLGLLN